MTIVINTKREIKEHRIACMLVSAFEGGCNYWIDRQEFKSKKPKVLVMHLDEGSEDGQVWETYDWPLCEGGDVSFVADDGNGKTVRYHLNLETIAKGLQVMADKFPRHFQNFLDENDDAETADVFVQCLCFGDTVYG
jgi:hypothetical protein